MSFKAFRLSQHAGRFLRYFGIAKEKPEAHLLDQLRGWIDVPNPTLGVVFFAVHLSGATELRPCLRAVSQAVSQGSTPGCAVA